MEDKPQYQAFYNRRGYSYVKYPDGKCSSLMPEKNAYDYASIFGGTVHHNFDCEEYKNTIKHNNVKYLILFFMGVCVFFWLVFGYESATIFLMFLFILFLGRNL